MKTETYEIARLRLLTECKLAGYTVKHKLKVPQVVITQNDTLFFHTQAVYLNKHSLFLDIRNLSYDKFIVAVRRAIVS